MMNNERCYGNALDWIHSLSRFGMKPGLERITAILEMLGNPHRLVKHVHITGTNGKGSTAAMLASILDAAGYRVGLYTSPYILSFTNRMAVKGKDIEHGELVELVGRVRPVVEEVAADQRFGQPTEFEVVTALAFTFFARKQVDLVVLEVGLGGRLDATNVVHPLLSIITNVSLEHTEVLGATVEAVATEKAGIIKKGVPVLTASDDEEVLGVIRRRAAALDAPLHCLYPCRGAAGKTMKHPVFSRRKVTDRGQYFDYCGFERSFEDLFIALRGSYQLCNAATALAAVELLARQGYMISEKAVRRGLKETEWPGRLELLNNSPKLVVDGAHNPAAIKQMAQTLPDYFSYRRLVLVFGIMADKDAPAMMSALLPLADEVIFARAAIPRAADPGRLAEIARDQLHYDHNRIKVVEEVGTALETGLSQAGPDDLVLVTGSFYIVSEARAHWRQPVT